MSPALAGVAFTATQRARLATIADVVDPEPLGSFRSGRAARALQQADVILGHWGCPKLDAKAVGLAPNLRLLAYAAGTVKGVVTPALWSAGVAVTSAAAANARPVAEYTLAAILFANKGAFASREWLRDQRVRVKRPRPLGNCGARVGIIGASFVGRRVIELLAPFDLELVVADPFLRRAEATRLGVKLVPLPELLRTSTVVSIHAPSLPSTRGMIGAEELALLPDGATLINTARGALVDTDALVVELRTRRISAVLDVTDPEPLPAGHALRKISNVFVTPHLAGAQGNELVRLADLAIGEVERFAKGRRPLHPVVEADLARIA
jgi:phosphoglycerate dehydrogenase-like enzyme